MQPSERAVLAIEPDLTTHVRVMLLRRCILTFNMVYSVLHYSVALVAKKKKDCVMSFVCDSEMIEIKV